MHCPDCGQWMRLASSMYGGGTDEVTGEGRVVTDFLYQCDTPGCWRQIHDRRETIIHEKDRGVIRGDLAKGKLF